MPTRTQAPAGGPASAARPPLSAVWLAAAIGLPIAVAASMPLSAVDLAYLIAAGERLFTEGHVLRTDPFLAWTLGESWLNQQWAAGIVLAAVYRPAGWLGLALLRGALQSAFLVSIYRGCRAAGADRRRAAFLTLGASALTVGLMGLRAQLLGMVCFGLALWLVEGRHAAPRRLWWALPLQVAWSNLHGSFPLGPLLLGCAALEDRADHRAEARRTLLLAAGALAATLITPFGVRAWRYVLDVAVNPRVIAEVSEWDAPTLRSVPGALFLLSGLGVAAFLARREGRIPGPSLLRLGGFFLLGLGAIRATVWWVPVAAVELARLLPSARDRPDPRSPANATLIGVVLVVVLASLARWLPYANHVPAHLLTYAPQGVTRVLEDLLEPGERFFHAQGWGSWFELALPENPTTVDSRFEVMPEARWREYEAVSSGRAEWEEILERWGVRVLALSWEQQEDLIPIVLRDPDWRLVYEDEDGLVLVRT